MWSEYILNVIKVILIIGCLPIGLMAYNHYKNKRYQQAIFNMLALIFMAICIK